MRSARGPKVPEGHGFFAPTEPSADAHSEQFYADHERDMADPEYAGAYRKAASEMAGNGQGHGEDLPPLPTSLYDWHATVRLHRNPAYLRSLADDMERKRNGERPAPSEQSLADLTASYEHPTPEQLRKRVEWLRAECARLATLADDVERRLAVPRG